MKDMLLMMQIECLIFLVPIALLFVAITALVIWCTVATCAVTVFNFVYRKSRKALNRLVR